ncbi:hypothetical protein [Vibrio metschnikovii]|uniref:hypothetical protein n=1 Tax=Vibrio metschnikovii TaxID=28172 RepID=UPI0002EA4FB6|nr:hypothetical protein [Vibrio metschnikovii]
MIYHNLPQINALIENSPKACQAIFYCARWCRFYDANHSIYFVGSEKGGFKFSRGQFNHPRYIEGPEELK